MGGDRLLGIHAITAYGKQDDGLAAIQVDVEESEMPAKMYARGNIQNLHGLQELKLFDAGSQQSLTIYGTFPNGDDLDLINSTYLKLVSLNPKVVSVGEEGMLIAIGPGATYVTATYTLGAETLQITVLVSVAISDSGLIFGATHERT